ncbi:hypothetical protein EYF80_063392 [Liparis tanakae]|uniref:Uncharacterized protein n=1 Tax=Liparis tanakae TaxID=230148 RepID=A0A4Z2EDW8_9TELE|nr:hypothetical protein EYF80_063392 [Liparis tanakae]
MCHTHALRGGRPAGGQQQQHEGQGPAPGQRPAHEGGDTVSRLHTPSTRQAHAKHTPSTRQAHGKHTPSTRQAHGKHTASTRQAHGTRYRREGTDWKGQRRSLGPPENCEPPGGGAKVSRPITERLLPPHTGEPPRAEGGRRDLEVTIAGHDERKRTFNLLSLHLASD